MKYGTWHMVNSWNKLSLLMQPLMEKGLNVHVNLFDHMISYLRVK